MKIALLISGHRRSVSTTIERLVALKKSLSCDVFVHTWAEQDMSTRTWRVPDPNNKYFSDEELISALEPKSYLIESAIPEKVARVFKGSSGANPLSGAHHMIYGMLSCFNLLEKYAEAENKKYDVCIRFRFDVICEEINLLLRDCRNALENNIIVMPQHNWASALGCHFDGVIIAQPMPYGASLNLLAQEFNAYVENLKIGERFMPELIICHIIRKRVCAIKYSLSSFGIIRSGNIREQHFGPLSNNIVSKMRSNVDAYKSLNSISSNSRHSLTFCTWAENSNIVLRALVRFSYPLYKSLKSHLFKTTI